MAHGEVKFWQRNYVGQSKSGNDLARAVQLVSSAVCVASSSYLVLFDCASCTSLDTGVPFKIKMALAILGMVYSLIILGNALNSRFLSKFNALICLTSILTLGWLTATSIAGVWHFCPVCKVFWLSNAVFIIASISKSVEIEKWIVPTLVAAFVTCISAISFQIFPMTLKGLLPKEAILQNFDSLKGRSLAELGVDEKNVVLIGNCSPCARRKLDFLFHSMKQERYIVISKGDFLEKLPKGWLVKKVPSLFDIFPEIKNSKGALVIRANNNKIETCKVIE